MKIRIYAIPIGVMGNQMVTTVEVCIPDMLMTISFPNDSCIYNSQEELDAKYEQAQLIQELYIDDDNLQSFLDLKELLSKKQELENKVTTVLNSFVEDAVEEFKNKPRIEIASESDLNNINDSIIERSGIIMP